PVYSPTCIGSRTGNPAATYRRVRTGPRPCARAGTTTVGAARRGRRDHIGVARRNRLRPILPETQAGTGHQRLLCLRQADLPKVHAAVWPRLFRLLPESGGTTRRPGSCLRRAEVCRTGKRMEENETCPGRNRRGGGFAIRRF